MQQKPILEIKNFSLGIEIDKKIYPILKNVNFSFFKGKIHAIVGESGCGKTMSVMSVLKLLPKGARVLGGKIIYDNNNILDYNEKQMRQIRGRKIALIPQDPMTSLNPLYTIENQLLEVVMLHNDVSKDEALKIAIKTLESVEFKDAKNRIKSYPHELSGGMKQRVGIARAYTNDPEILIMDEPFGALDAQTRYAMEEEIIKIWQKQKRTIIFVTNNIEEAVYLGDRIVLFSARPAKIKKIYENSLPRPRDMISKEFLDLRTEISANSDLAL